MSTALSYCEPVWATSDGRWHIRLLDPGELQKFNGGLTKGALCGAEVAWDVDVEVKLLDIEKNHTCVVCADALALALRRTVVLS